MGPRCHEYITEHCKGHPFRLGIDGSSDTDIEKMNPVTIRVFDINRSKFVTSHFYDMCVTTGRDAGKFLINTFSEHTERHKRKRSIDSILANINESKSKS